MIKCRAAARNWLKSSDGDRNLRDKLDNSQDAPSISWNELWEDIKSNEDLETSDKCENLLVVESLLKCWTEAVKAPDDVEIVNEIFSWVSNSILPSKEYAKCYDEAHLAGAKVPSALLDKFKKPRLEATVGISILGYLNEVVPIREAQDPVSVIAALAAFTCEKDPWTTPEAHKKVSTILAIIVPCTPRERDSLASLLRNVHERAIKPVFSKSKNPDITSSGRKNFYPIPQPRFDPSLFSIETDPWKHECIYITTVLSWVISQYPPSDKRMIEDQFGLLYPPIRTLIDDISVVFKARGCDLLSQLLAPIELSRSDIFSRSDLTPDLEKTLNQLLKWLPTTTPEEESLHLLSFVYPTLFSLIRTSYPLSYELPKLDPNSMKPVYKSDKEYKARQRSLERILSNSIIPSCRHISSPSSAEDTISSYPYPRLSAFLLTQLVPVLRGLGTKSVNHIQDLLPLLMHAMENPFGTAYLPLIVAAVEATRTLILNAWPRLSDKRMEILKALGICWINIWEDEKDGILKGTGRSTDTNGSKRLDRGGDHEYYKKNVNFLKIELQELSLLLRSAADASNENSADEDSDDRETDMDVEAEFEKLVDADERLRPLLLPEEYPNWGVPE